MVINGHYPGEGRARSEQLRPAGPTGADATRIARTAATGGSYYTFKTRRQDLRIHLLADAQTAATASAIPRSSQFVSTTTCRTAFSVIGSNTGVSSGRQTKREHLLAARDEWYVEVNDGRSTTTGPIWNFNAAATVNTPPVAVNDTYLVEEDRQLIIPISGVLGNDQDADDDALTAILVQPPQSGSLFLAADGAFTYTPGDNHGRHLHRASDASSHRPRLPACS